MSNLKSNKESEIIDKMDKAIHELVYEKTKIIKAYNYYHGRRDPEQFRHLEENYGIGTPTSVVFIPLVRKHIDILIGEYLSAPFLPRISCKDEDTLSNINREKQLMISNEIIQKLSNHLKSSIYASISGEQGKADSQIEKEIEDIKENIDSNFISEYEKAGQNIVEYSCQSRSIDFSNKRKTLLTDLLISGTCYYQVVPSEAKTNVNFKLLNPINTFIDRNPESSYLKHSQRGVIRKYLTKVQILREFGELLSNDDLEILDNKSEDYGFDDMSTTYVRSYNETVAGSDVGESDGILGGYEVTPLLPNENYSRNFRVYPVYYVEWLQTDKEKGEFITNRYEGVRIGSKIYIPKGKSENVIRSMDDPKKCTLSINGMFYSDRNGDPTSLILSTVDLQDKYDVLHFYRDNVISESGSVGDWVDVAFLPKFLGSAVPEKLMKWKAYKKQGLALFDSSQEGNVMNTHFNGYDDTIKVQTIQAIDLALQRTEETCSGITGVFRERLGGIEQKDAVSNVQVGIKNSSLITKQYYQVMDLMSREILIDIMNIAKIVFKNGITGSLILGDRLNKIFTALPEHFTITDYDIHIPDSSEIIKEQETIKQLTFEFTKSGAVDPDIILETVSSKGLTRLKADVSKALQKKKDENSQLEQLSGQVEQLNSELQQTKDQAKKLQSQVEKQDAEKIQLEKDKLDFQKEIDWFKAKSEDEFKDNKTKLEEKRVDLEGLQLFNSDKRDDEIRDS